MKVLVTGGVRSGKSRHAESLLRKPVTYVAPGPTPEEDADPDWASRVRMHQERRPDSWSTLETRDLAAAMSTPGPVLLDCLGTWLAAVVDDAALWDAPTERVHAHVTALLDRALPLLVEATADRVLVTNEVGLGIVPEHRSGRLFRDLLGTVNQRVAEVCDEVHLVVAGRVLRL